MAGFGTVRGGEGFYGPIRQNPQTPEEWAKYYDAEIAARRERQKANEAAKQKRLREMEAAKAEAATRAEAIRAKAQAEEEAAIARSLRLRGASPAEIPGLVRDIRRQRLLAAGDDTSLPADDRYQRM